MTGPGRASIHFHRPIANRDAAVLDDPGVDAAQAHGLALGRVDEDHRGLAIALHEARAAVMGGRGDFDNGRSDLEALAGRQVVGAEVYVDEEVVRRRAASVLAPGR